MKRHFDQDFWIPERQFFTLPLDGDKKKVDSLSSKICQLLWSGIVDDERAQDRKHCIHDAISRGLSACIAGYDQRIEELASKKYGHTKMLRQLKGVSPITVPALA